MTITGVDKANAITEWKWGFTDAYASGVNPSKASIPVLGAGMSVSQAGGNLIVNAGTTPYAETIIRLKEPFNFDGIMRYGLTLSQRIANNNFAIELVDVVGDNLPITVLGATSISVNILKHGWNSADVGKGVWLAACTVANTPSVYATVASIPDEDNVVFTVEGFPANGTGVCSVFGMNHCQVIYNGTTATALGGGYTTARNGYRNPVAAATINTTASGHIGVFESVRHSDAAFLDGPLAGSNGGPKYTTRSFFDQNIPDIDSMYMQIRVFNGAVAPASNTVLTMAFIDMQAFNVQPVQIAAIDTFSNRSTLNVSIANQASGGTGSQTVQGAAAHDAVISGNPVRVAGRALTANYAAVATGDVADVVTTLVGALVNKPFSIPEADWSYSGIAGGIVNNTAVPIKAAAGAGLRNYITGFSLQNASAVATEVLILDGATVIWRGYVGTTAINSVVGINFISPLKSTANAALNVQVVTNGSAILANAQGYVAP